MAQFYGSMKGSRGEATRLGTKNSGFDAHIRGWNIGARVYLRHVDGKDVVSVYKTGGSNGATNDVLIAEFTQ